MEKIDSIWIEYNNEKSKKTKDDIFKKYSWIVQYVVNKLGVPENSILDKEDLINIGIIGLSESIDKFDLSKNVKFESYAITRVRGSIQDELRKLDWLSRTARKKVNDITSIKDKFLKEQGIEVSDSEIISKLGITSDQYNSYLHAMEVSRSNYSFIDSDNSSDEDGYDVVENISDKDESNQLEDLIEHEKIELLKKFLKDLPDKKRLVIALYYYENLTFNEIGKLIDVTEGRVSQIHSEVIKKLRVRINDYENA